MECANFSGWCLAAARGQRLVTREVKASFLFNGEYEFGYHSGDSLAGLLGESGASATSTRWWSCLCAMQTTM